MTDYSTHSASPFRSTDYGSPAENNGWMLPLLIAVAVGLLAIIVWLWFRCGDEPTVDWLINGAREMPVRSTS